MAQKRFSARSILNNAEKIICIISLASLVLVAAAEAVARLFRTGVPASNGLLMHTLLLLGLFSGMYTSRSNGHLSIALIQYVKNDKYKRIIEMITGFLTVFICVIIAWSSVSFIKIAIEPKLVGFVPNMVFAAAMPLAYAVMAVRFAMRLPSKNRVLPAAALVLGCLASFI